ncbi:hypothetical protein [Acinetobacter terrae]|uniref:Uncharacterized protein n=1 Tax=Acinetobacter terrae TaxID=2731247 RepID=A0A8E4F852_9GAMM|nr:hypothetical protein [Acinetobacter terrae]NNH38023.1 hypothetical protein [Acinetobacter terrae]
MSGLRNLALAQLAVKNLRIGSVIYKHCNFTTPEKNKYMVVVSLQPRLLVLLINSEINEFYIKKKLDHFHVPINQSEHNFLDHDSFANCIEAHTAFDLSTLKSELLENYSEIHKGWLSDNCLENAYHAVKSNNILRTGEQKEIIISIEEQLPHLAIKLHQ